MKWFFIGLSFVSGFVTLVLLFLPGNTTVVANTVQATLSKKELGNYIGKKGTPGARPETFKTLLSAKLDVAPTVLGTATESAVTDSSPSATPKKSTYTIAVLGDSMVDTLGADVSDIKNALKNRYPFVEFKLLNYGAASTNIEYGLRRLTESYTYLGKSVPALLTQNPDIIVVESFAYNHWENTKADLDRHWLTIAKIIDTIKSRNRETKIVLAATIAPHCPTYTDGSANLPTERKFKQCMTVKKYLENLINFAKGENLPLADSYNPSIDATGEGNPEYINQADHIHPSEKGRKFFGQKVAQAIITNKLLQ